MLLILYTSTILVLAFIQRERDLKLWNFEQHLNYNIHSYKSSNPILCNLAKKGNNKNRTVCIDIYHNVIKTGYKIFVDNIVEKL